MEIFDTNGIFHLKPLFIGSMKEALEYNIKFDSTIPKIYGLPTLPEGKLLFSNMDGLIWSLQLVMGVSNGDWAIS